MSLEFGSACFRPQKRISWREPLFIYHRGGGRQQLSFEWRKMFKAEMRIINMHADLARKEVRPIWRDSSAGTMLQEAWALERTVGGPVGLGVGLRFGDGPWPHSGKLVVWPAEPRRADVGIIEARGASVNVC